MLTISTIPEALAELAKVTGREWTDSELLSVATDYGIELHATRPITTEFVTEKFVAGRGLVTISEPPWEGDYLLEPFIVPDIDAELAVIFPVQVNELRINGETRTSYPANHDQIEGQTRRFTQPVRVTRETVRIKAEALHRVLEAWRKNQPAPVVPAGAPETPEQRRAWWLELFEAEEKCQKRGALQRLADSQGIDRSNLNKAIKKARAERAEQKRAGNGWIVQPVQDGKRRG